MPNQIERDVFVLKSNLKNPIDYVRGTNLLPIIMHFRDMSIPSGATATVFVQKPSGKAVQASAAISGDSVTITVTTQMFAEIGLSVLQIEITDGEDVLVTFAQPVNVYENYVNPDAPESENESDFFDELEQAAQTAQQAANAANEAAEAANEAAASVTPQAIQTAVNNYLTQNPVTVDAVPTLTGTTLVFPDGEQGG